MNAAPQFHVILFQPEIPPNTGNVIRLCANTGAQLHLVEPLGFALDDARLGEGDRHHLPVDLLGLQRAGMLPAALHIEPAHIVQQPLARRAAQGGLNRFTIVAANFDQREFLIRRNIAMVLIDRCTRGEKHHPGHHKRKRPAKARHSRQNSFRHANPLPLAARHPLGLACSALRHYRIDQTGPDLCAQGLQWELVRFKNTNGQLARQEAEE